MNRELAEVRRYWPRAKRSGQLLVDGAVLWTVYAADRSDRVRIVVYADGRAAVGKWVMTVDLQPTIAEAMRVAGFGVRPLGIRAIYRKGWHELRRDTQIAMGFSPRVSSENHTRLQSTQRPRKGARLGRRKREGQP